MRCTPYATEVAPAADINGDRIERLFIKERAQVEIRFSWWKDGRMMMRPLDLSEAELLPLMRLPMREGLFTVRLA
jgi:hypothetical protein